VCRSLDAGYTPRNVINYIYAHTDLNNEKAMWFSAAALEVYCPWRHGQDLDESRPSGGSQLHTVAPNPELTGYAERGGRGHGHK
jgi:hypothetical protein